MTIKDQFVAMLKDAADDFGVDLQTGREEVAEYMADRAAHLSMISHEPGFGRAVSREAQSVAARAGLALDDAAGTVDNLWYGLIAGALRIAAVALIA